MSQGVMGFLPSTALYPCPISQFYSMMRFHAENNKESLLAWHKNQERTPGEGSSFTSLTQHTHTSLFLELYFMKYLTATGVLYFLLS